MPRARPKTTIDHLAAALEATQKVDEALALIDGKTCTPALRRLLRQATGLRAQLAGVVVEAMRTTAPKPPKASRPPASRGSVAKRTGQKTRH